MVLGFLFVCFLVFCFFFVFFWEPVDFIFSLSVLGIRERFIIQFIFSPNQDLKWVWVWIDFFLEAIQEAGFPGDSGGLLERLQLWFWTSHLQNLGRANVCCFELRFVGICYDSPKKLTHHFLLQKNFLKFVYSFIYFWLPWVFAAARRLSPVAVTRGYSLAAASGLLIAGTSPGAEHRFQGTGAQQL